MTPNLKKHCLLRQDIKLALFMTYAFSVAPVCRDTNSHRRDLRLSPFFTIHRLDLVLRDILTIFIHEADVMSNFSDAPSTVLRRLSMAREYENIPGVRLDRYGTSFRYVF